MNSSAKRGIAVIVTVVVAITLLIWAGVHNARERRLEMQQQNAKVVLAPADGTTAGAADGMMTPALQGKTAPAFSLVDLDGKKVALADFKGKPVLVNFWASWCGPCKLEMPWFAEFEQKYKPQGLVVLGLAADEAPKSVLAGVAKKAGVQYPILLADDAVEKAYGGVGYLPESFYVGRDGKVLLETAGLSDNGGKDQIEANIKKLVEAGQ